MNGILEAAGDFLATAAPTLATLFGGPLAGGAVTALESVLGLHPAPEATADQRKSAVASALTVSTPDQIVAIRQLDAAIGKQLLDAGVALEASDTSDRQSARARQSAVRDRIPGLLAVAITIGFFALLSFLAMREVPAGSRDLLNVMLGALGAGWTGVVSYYFGSSAGHEEASAILARAAAK